MGVGERKRSRGAAATALAALALWFALARGGGERRSRGRRMCRRYLAEAGTVGVAIAGLGVRATTSSSSRTRRLASRDETSVLRCDGVDGGMGGETATSARVAKDGERCVGFSVFYTCGRERPEGFHWCFFKAGVRAQRCRGESVHGVKMDRAIRGVTFSHARRLQSRRAVRSSRGW